MGATKRASVAAVSLPNGTGKAALAGATSPVSSSEQRSCLTSQLRKTKICVYHLKGACQYGANCAFAHSCTELQSTPDLRKTRLCQAFEQGGCNNKDCSFAHGEEELRSTNLFYKKTLCIWNQKGKCRNGDQCRFAHGTSELRTSQGGGAGNQKEHGGTQASGKQASAKANSGAKMLKEPMKVLAAGCVPAQPAVLPPLLPAALPVEASELDQTLLGGMPTTGVPFLPDAYGGAKDASAALPGALDAWWQWPLSYGMVPQDIASDLERIREDVESLTQKCAEIQMQMNSTDPNMAAYLKMAPGLEVEAAGAGEEQFPTFWA